MAITGIDNSAGPGNAYDLVNEAWDKYQGQGDKWVLKASESLDDLTALHIEPITFSVDYNVDAFLPRFIRPTKPTAPSFGKISFDAPQAPSLDAVGVPDIGPAPAEPDFDSLTAYAPPQAPTEPLPTAPADVTPVLDPIDAPDRPVYTLPEVPTLYALNLPETPTIVLPEFDGQRPVFDLQMPEDGALAWAETPYTSALKDELTAKIRDMLQGNYGLPLAIERALFDRARGREDQLSRKQVMEVAEDLATRNLSEPSGLLAARLREVRADNRAKVSGLNRDIAIERAKEALQGIQFAMGQGMALEQTLIQQNLAINDRALRAAIFVREYGITRVNALIAYFNLQQQAYATDAQVWRQRIEGELAKLEVMKAEIDGQRLVGEINNQLVQRYEAGIQAVKGLADIYRSDVEAAKAKGEINVQRIEAAKLILQRYDTQVRAWGELQNGHKIRVDAALGTTKFAETLASVFATRMQGYKTRGEAYFNEGKFQLERNAQTLEHFRAQLAGADQDLRGQIAQIDAQVRTFGAEVGLYEADGQIAQAESAAYDRTTSLKIENERNRVTAALEQARTRITQAMEVGKIMLAQIEAKADAIVQLAASANSGVNFGASLSGSLSESFSYGRSLSWSGDVPDHSGIGF